jgi:Tfp pilus assembly protein PilF
LTTFFTDVRDNRSITGGFSGPFVAHGLLEQAQEYGIVGEVPMKMPVAAIVAFIAAVSASPSFADARSDARAQVEFGISVAQRGLWREAIYRWEKATELDPTYVAAYNDLAIAYEHEGQLDKARKAYEKALELDPNNTQVRQNYELFKEINDRTSQGKEK